ncbi:hypothetical protein QNI16_06645 [Cytophagaceae bacterium YF14B1]|uniref:Peptidase E n=1 Tax=Xanthocytophaga flava TaxID=3048013 RepID=A0AAE3QMI1_9BACT|nr:DUF6702 family protein [Xanthocytophaga flavus]MDJ1480155.1 hypothetical protein [Xanthocytophaga flavus]
MNNSLGKRRFLLTLGLIFSIFILSSFRKHEFHSSLAEIHYNPTEKSLEVSLRVFSDDLGTALSKENKRTLKVEDNATIDPFIKQYLLRHFVLTDTKNARKSINWVGKEITVDVTWLYFEVPVAEEPNGLKINNTLLFESFDDQVNIVNVIYKSQKKTYLFKSDQTTQTIEL